MSVNFWNFEYSYKRRGKPVFVPNDQARRIGNDIKQQIEEAIEFDPVYFHFRDGGHIAALHQHRDHKYFARVDLERYFYIISRSRVQRAIADIGLKRARHYAKWSCVKNPYGNPAYALPYGFVQSPIVSTLVMMTSDVGQFLRTACKDVISTAYMDDISLSADSLETLQRHFDQLLDFLERCHFVVNHAKTRFPSSKMDLFNCNIEFQQTVVSPDRIADFHASPRSLISMTAFERYCESVEVGNT